MKLIELFRKDKVVDFAMVDDLRYNELNSDKWTLHSNGYAIRKGKRKTVYMHQIVLRTNLHVDHKDTNKLNNQEFNLRPSTHSQNQQNQKLRIDNTSGYKGVSWNKKDEKWMASIKFNKKKIHLKSWNTPEEAALAYDERAKEYFGEFARLNFP